MNHLDQKGLYFAGLSTIGFACAPILAKKGLGGVSPLFGGTVSVAAGVFVFTVIVLITGSIKRLFRGSGGALPFFVAAGINNTLAIACFYTALQQSLALIVVPLTSAFPLVTIFLSYLFLTEGEGLNRRVVVGALLVMGGTILLSLR